MANNVLRLLVAESSLEDAEYLVSTLRSAGIAARPTRVTAIEELEKVLTERALDVVVCAIPEGTISLADLVRAVKNSGKDIPVIAYVESPDPQLIEDAISQGANNVVFHGVPHHLQTVLERELGLVNLRRTFRRTTTALQESEKRCQSLLNSAQDAIAYVHEGMHVYANRNYLQRFGYADFDEMAGLPLLDLVVPGDHQRLKDCLIRIAKGEEVPDTLELEGKRADGTPMTLCMEFAEANYDEETCTQILIRAAVVEPEPEPEPEPAPESEVELEPELLEIEAETGEETDELQEPETDLEKEIDNLRAQDLLTGLYNRIYFMDQLERAIDSASETDGSMLYIELDNYRGIVDQVGHVGADTIIVDVARLIEDRQGQNDVAARFGDFAFTVLCQGRTLRSAEELAEEIRHAIEDHISEGKKHAVTVTASIGIAPISELTTEVQEVLANATAASAQANAQGGNRVEVYAPSATVNQDESREGNAELAVQVRQGLEKDRFFLVFQPLVSLHGHGGEYYEALLRMHGDNDEEIPASEFIELAEQYGMVKDIDRWVIHTAVSIVRKENQEDRQVRLFLKISPQSLADESLIPWLRKLIEETGIQGESLVFEFPESKAVTNLKPARVFVRGIKELKCGFVLEQFGTGVNSFQLLKHLPANYLKIDRSFSRELSSNEEHRNKIKEITDQGHALGKLIIAEFVEDAPSMSVLYQIGVNYVQGNFLQEPEKMLSYDFS